MNKGLKLHEENLVAEVRKAVEHFLPTLEEAVKRGQKNVSMSMTYRLRGREDGELDVFFSAKPNVQWDADAKKARIDNGQLTLI